MLASRSSRRCAGDLICLGSKSGQGSGSDGHAGLRISLFGCVQPRRLDSFTAGGSLGITMPAQDSSRQDWEPLARLVLEASYEATLLSALRQARKHDGQNGSRLVCLVSVNLHLNREGSQNAMLKRFEVGRCKVFDMSWRGCLRELYGVDRRCDATCLRVPARGGPGRPNCKLRLTAFGTSPIRTGAFWQKLPSLGVMPKNPTWPGSFVRDFPDSTYEIVHRVLFSVERSLFSGRGCQPACGLRFAARSCCRAFLQRPTKRSPASNGGRVQTLRGHPGCWYPGSDPT